MSEEGETAERLMEALRDLVLVFPGFAGCGDISREKRVYSEVCEILGENMPKPVFAKRGLADRTDKEKTVVVGHGNLRGPAKVTIKGETDA